MQKRTFFFLGLALLLTAAKPRTTSPHITPAMAEIKNGVLTTESTEEAGILLEIKNQLKFTIGSLNGIGGGAAIDGTLRVSILEIQVGDGGTQVRYSASFLIAFPERYALPSSYTFILPDRADQLGLRRFHEAYGAQCSSENHGWSGFFYDYRPAKCSQLAGHSQAPFSVRLRATLKREAEYPMARPETDKVWEDGVLNAIAIFGNTESRDGARSAREFYQLLTQWFGRPVSDTNQQHQGFFIQTLRFRFQRGDMVVHIFDLYQGNVQTLGPVFQTAFEALTPDADYVAYNGHSGLGANIRAITRLGVFKKNQYKVYFLNGCDSFSYVDGSLVRAHHELNPEASPTKFIDLITTVLPSAFNQMAYGTARVLLGLHTGNASYHQILSNIANASPLVMGEEDNGTR